MADLIETVVASRASNGPLVQDVSLVVLAYQADTYGESGLLPFVNQALIGGLNGLPEGARMELTIRGWTDSVTGQSWADTVANRVQAAWRSGRVIDPDTRRPAEAWPEHPDRIIWGDVGTDTVTLRVVKNSAVIIVLGLLVGILALSLLYVLWGWWRSSDWIAKWVTVSPGAPGQPPQVGITPGAPPPPGGPGAGSAGDFLDWLKENAILVAGGAAVLLAAPFVIRQLGEINKAGRDAGR